ncbi:MAG: sulfurtransferase TusA family protein [Nitrososphaerota archaeon]
MSGEIKVNRVVDARGSFCPGPLIELVKTIREVDVGDVVSVYASDSTSKQDIPLWVRKMGHELIGIFERDGYAEIVVRKTY